MAMKRVGPILYGLLFCVIVPLLLAGWAAVLEISAPAVHEPLIGSALLAVGIALMLAGFAALWRRGGGLPMNAYPPPRLVQDGLYGLVPHPIYLGFGLAVPGTALLTGSAAGLWLATPLAALGCLALVIGYERPALLRRHGQLPRPLLTPVVAADQPLTWGRRIGAAAGVLVPWLAVGYLGMKRLGMPADAVSAYWPGEAAWPVWPWTWLIYITAYIAVPAAFLLVPDAPTLRQLMIRSWIGMGLVTLGHLCLPLYVPDRPIPLDTLAGRLLAWERAWDAPPIAAFPSYHVVWSGLAAWALARHGRGWRIAVWLWFLGVSLSCVTTGMHALIDVLAAWGVLALALNLERVWAGLLRWSERMANAWHCWRLGPLRVMNHALWGGLAGGVGGALALLLAGQAALPVLAWMIVCGLLGAALWAQWVEGSPLLLRPFGYYGGVLGIVAGGLLALAAGQAQAWPALAALACAGPWIQALGRVRCLIQGCCHGHAAPSQHGIRVTNPHSRVCAIDSLCGTPIHATQLYSILGNLVIGCLLTRLWLAGAALSLIAGLYLMLAGIARFMEEGYRGETQTRVLAGLPIYQWLSIASLAAGMLVCLIPSAAAPDPVWGIWPEALGLGLFGFVICAFAQGVDFPESRRRFARLSG